MVLTTASASAEDAASGFVTWGINRFADAHDGALVLDVAPKGSAFEENLGVADTAGLVPGDVITAVDGAPIRSAADLKLCIKNSRPFVAVELVIQRFDAVLKKTLVPAGRLRLEVTELDQSFRSFPIPGATEPKSISPTATGEMPENINVLQNVIIDRKSGQIAVMGTYDPKYATGAIPYLDLLKTALNFPYPHTSLEPARNISHREFKAKSNLPQTEAAALLERLRAYEEVTPWQFFTQVLADPATERERQKLIRYMAAAYGLSRQEYVALYNYGYLDSNGSIAPPEIGQVLVKALRHLGWVEAADAYDHMARDTIDDFRQALKVLGREKEEAALGVTAPGHDQMLALTCLAMLDVLKPLPQEQDIWQLRLGVRANSVSASEILKLMYQSFTLYLIDRNIAMREAAEREAAEGKGTAGATRPIWREGSKLGGAPSSVNAKAGEMGLNMVRIESYNNDPNSQLARIMYEADYALKAHGSTDLFANIPGYMTFAERFSRADAQVSSTDFSFNSRLWFEPRRVEMEASSDKSLVTFGMAAIELNSAQDITASSPDDKKTFGRVFAEIAKHVNENFDSYAVAMPAFHSLREASKVIALARWLRQNRIVVDLDAVRQERWNNPKTIQGWSFREFEYFRPKAEGSYGQHSFRVKTRWTGGVSFTKGNWTNYGPASKATETKVEDQLVLASQLSRAAVKATTSDLEKARYYSELSAQALAGKVSRSDLAKQNITLPEFKRTQVSAGEVLLAQRASSLLQHDPGHAHAQATLDRISAIYDEAQSRPVSASDVLRELKRTPHVPAPSASRSVPRYVIDSSAFYNIRNVPSEPFNIFDKWAEGKNTDGTVSPWLEDTMDFYLLWRGGGITGLLSQALARWEKMRLGTERYLLGWMDLTNTTVACSGNPNCTGVVVETDNLIRGDYWFHTNPTVNRLFDLTGGSHEK